MTMVQRLEKLERQNKWMKRIGAVAVALVAAVFLMGQGKEKELPDLVGRSRKADRNWRSHRWWPTWNDNPPRRTLLGSDRETGHARKTFPNRETRGQHRERPRGCPRSTAGTRRLPATPDRRRPTNGVVSPGATMGDRRAIPCRCRD